MAIRGKYRRHSPHFKLQLCADIRSGKIGRREAAKTYSLSTNLLQIWLSQYDQGELSSEEAAANMVDEYEVKIAALERMVGQLTMELDLLKKSQRLRLASSKEESSIISGPTGAPFDGGAR